MGSAARYAYAGDKSDLTAATVFWDRVVNHHTFATGGHGKDEYFREPDRLGNITEGRTAETCNVYNMLKLTRKLFALQPDIRYAEFHERALFNHILGSIDSEDGATCYMVPVGSGVRREYADMQRSFTCCVGTGMESHALHGLGLVLRRRQQAVRQSLCAVDRAMGSGGSEARRWRRRSPKATRRCCRSICVRRSRSRSRCAGRHGRATVSSVRVNGQAVASDCRPGRTSRSRAAGRSGDRDRADVAENACASSA